MPGYNDKGIIMRDVGEFVFIVFKKVGEELEKSWCWCMGVGPHGQTIYTVHEIVLVACVSGEKV